MIIRKRYKREQKFINITLVPRLYLSIILMKEILHLPLTYSTNPYRVLHVYPLSLNPEIIKNMAIDI